MDWIFQFDSVNYSILTIEAHVCNLQKSKSTFSDKYQIRGLAHPPLDKLVLIGSEKNIFKWYPRFSPSLYISLCTFSAKVGSLREFQMAKHSVGLFLKFEKKWNRLISHKIFWDLNMSLNPNMEIHGVLTMAWVWKHFEYFTK